MENAKRNIVDIVGSSALKLSEVEDRVKVSDLALENLRVTENNHTTTLEKKLESLRYTMENFSADTNKIKNNLEDQSRETLDEVTKNLGKLNVY